MKKILGFFGVPSREPFTIPFSGTFAEKIQAAQKQVDAIPNCGVEELIAEQRGPARGGPETIVSSGGCNLTLNYTPGLQASTVGLFRKSYNSCLWMWKLYRSEQGPLVIVMPWFYENELHIWWIYSAHFYEESEIQKIAGAMKAFLCSI
jgi:hypothetical protein